MKWVKAVQVNEHQTVPPCGTALTNGPKQKIKIKTMKILAKLVLAAVLFTTTLAAQAGWVTGDYRSNGTYVAPYYRSDCGSPGGFSTSSRDYVYRNPYAAQAAYRTSAAARALL